MLRIRFHGRGGQGMKTASRIVGTAAFREGYFARYSPVYGAERRGAPVTAFTRIDDSPILERRIITNPDMVVVADDALLDDAQAKPLQGLVSSGTVIMSFTQPEKVIRERYQISGPLVMMDSTELALSHTGTLAALSVVLGAATCQVAGLHLRSVEQAVQEELDTLGISPDQVAKNLRLVKVCYEMVSVLASLQIGQPASVTPPPRCT